MICWTPPVSKGEAPDANELSKGLDRNTKNRLKALYDNNSRMFDGTAKLKAVDFNTASSKDATVTGKTAALGKGGNVTDLKSSEPNVPKLDQATEFGLTGTKLSGEISNQAATKQPSTLLTSAKSALSPQKASAAGKAAAVAQNVEIPEIPKWDDADKGKYCAEWASPGQFEEQRQWLIYTVPYLEKQCAASPVEGCEQGISNGKKLLAEMDKYQKDPKGYCKTETQACPEGCECLKGYIWVAGNCELEKCIWIKNRIEEINGWIKIWTANPNYDPSIYSDDNGLKSSGAKIIEPAETTCGFFGPNTEYNDIFYTFESEIQAGSVAHENVHWGQCKPTWNIFGWNLNYKWDRELRKKGWPGPFEIPALEAEKRILEKATKTLGCRP